MFPTPKEDALPMYHRHLGLFLMPGECVAYNINENEHEISIGRIINFDFNSAVVTINHYIPQTAGHTTSNLNTNMKMLRQTEVTHTISIDSIIDFRFMFTMTEIRKYNIIIGDDDNTYYYLVSERVNTINTIIEPIKYDSVMVYNSVSLSVFLDLNLMREYFTKKLNSRTSSRLNRFSFMTASSNYTKSFLIRNMDVDIIEIRNIKKVCHRVGLCLQQINNNITLTEYILRMDSMIDLKKINSVLGGGILVGRRGVFTALGGITRAVANHDMLHYLLGKASPTKLATRYRYDGCVGCIDITFYSNTNLMTVKVRHFRSQLNEITDEALASFNLNTVRSTLEINNSVYYNNTLYTVTGVNIVDGSETLTLRSTIRNSATNKHVLLENISSELVTNPQI